jgi:DNA modification methylase
MRYEEFLQEKRITMECTGFDITDVSDQLFDFQKDMVRWAVKKGSSAFFAGTGLGKTYMQLEWARHIHNRNNKQVLILAPLAVASQTVQEGQKFGIDVTLCRSQQDVRTGINITNYDMLHKFDPSAFDGIVLDESSILKSFTGKVRNQIIESFASTPYKLACTATPAPNDHMELGNHAEFLGVMNRSEMLAMFFVHDGGNTSQWRLKGHSVGAFWEWVSSWAVMLTNPSDLGYKNNGFNLPPLEVNPIVVDKSGYRVKEALTLTERRGARRNSLDKRVAAAASLVADSHENWIIWCDMNAESEAITKAIDGAVEIRGSHDREYKTETMAAFANGEIDILVTKPSIAGFGMNFQICHNMAFVGLSDSFEKYYQAVRRCWRFGQKDPVNVYVITSEAEGAVVKNINRKEEDFKEMQQGMISATQELTKQNLSETKREVSEYMTEEAKGQNWTMYMEDNIERTRAMDDKSVDFIIYSPPFSSLYTYSDSDRDMGNCKTDNEFFEHFGFLAPELFRVLKSGRLMSVHCMNLPTTITKDGYIGIKDFRGDIIRLMQSVGFIYHSEVCIWKDPAVDVQRTKALGLLHKQLKKDSCRSRMSLPDYIMTFQKLGTNTDPVTHTDEQFHCNTWQKYASPVWFDIRQSNTLQRTSARDEMDERHICPLQLDVIQRCIELWTNPGDLVYDPFAGIGSVPYQAVLMGRRGIGCELKQSYFDQAIKNLMIADRNASAPKQVGFDYFKDEQTNIPDDTK